MRKWILWALALLCLWTAAGTLAEDAPAPVYAHGELTYKGETYLVYPAGVSTGDPGMVMLAAISAGPRQLIADGAVESVVQVQVEVGGALLDAKPDASGAALDIYKVDGLSDYPQAVLVSIYGEEEVLRLEQIEPDKAEAYDEEAIALVREAIAAREEAREEARASVSPLTPAPITVVSSSLEWVTEGPALAPSNGQIEFFSETIIPLSYSMVPSPKNLLTYTLTYTTKSPGEYEVTMTAHGPQHTSTVTGTQRFILGLQPGENTLTAVIQMPDTPSGAHSILLEIGEVPVDAQVIAR